MVVGLIWVAFDTGFLHNRHWQPPPSPSVLQGKIPVIDPDQGADFQTGCINMREGNSPFNAILWHTTTLMILLDSRESSSATGIILPFSDDYQQRLDNLTLPTISTFLHTSCNEHFTKKYPMTITTPCTPALKWTTSTAHLSAEPLRDKTLFLNFICDFSTNAAQTPFYYFSTFIP